MERIIIGLIVIAVGLASIIFRREFVRKVIRVNNEGGLGWQRYGKKEEKQMLRTARILGSIFIVVGILVLLGIWGKE